MDTAVCKEALKDFEGALADYNSAIKVNNSQERYYYFRGALKDKMGDTEGALSDMDNAIKYWDDFAHARLWRAALLMETGQYLKALDDFSKSHLEEKDFDNPDYAKDFMRRGICKHKTGDKEGACFDLNIAAKFDSTAKVNLGLLCN